MDVIIHFFLREKNMIKSMTAFAKKHIQAEFGAITWEVRSVNNRYLDVNFRLPELCRELETKLRACVNGVVERGRIDATLHYQPGLKTSSNFVINHSLVEQLDNAATETKKIFGEKSISINLTEILKWPGVLQVIAGDQSELFTNIISLFELTLADLSQGRSREGEKLQVLIEKRLDQVTAETKKVDSVIAEVLVAQRKRMLEKFENAKVEVDANRLEQELVLIAQKVDVTEEIDRIKTHVSEVWRVLEVGGAVGRRLDFLMQELNREANTLGSKSASEITTQISVELKVLIEQMREQIQNIE
jgi:uncharacterized protein (TIGR00255 family)